MQAYTLLAIGGLLTGLAAQDQETAPSRPQKVDVGAHPEFTFQGPLWNGRGVRSLADLRGKPTIIEFWGTR